MTDFEIKRWVVLLSFFSSEFTQKLTNELWIVMVEYSAVLQKVLLLIKIQLF